MLDAIRTAFHRFAPAGMENPRVMKSPSFRVDFPDENKLFRLSFVPSFLRFACSSSSASTFAVSDAVAAFLIPPLGVAVPVFFSDTSVVLDAWLIVTDIWLDGMSAVSVSPFFFLFLLEPVAFLREWVRPCSFNL